MRAIMGERSEVPDFVKTPKFAGVLNLFDCKMVGVKFVFKFMYIFFDNIYYIYSQDFIFHILCFYIYRYIVIFACFYIYRYICIFLYLSLYLHVFTKR